jgi:hypothetical protein
MRLAILMLAHKNEDQVNRLVGHLVKGFDVYIHVDKRSRLAIQEHPRLFVCSEYKGFWGSFNLVLATLCLLRQANRRGYDRYMLISGQDLPLKTNDEIFAFFKTTDSEYIDIKKLPYKGWPDDGALARVTKYWAVRKRKPERFVDRLLRKIKEVLLQLKKARPLDHVFYGGEQWFNLSSKGVQKILDFIDSDEGRVYLNRFNKTLCSDEIFFQTLIMKLNNLEITSDSLRFTDWDTGPAYPRTLTIVDLERLKNSPALFARKFDTEVDTEIIDSVYAWLKQKSESPQVY